MTQFIEIKLKNIHANTIIGIDDWEREEKQPVIINILIKYDGTAVIKSNNINDAVNYAIISQQVLNLVEKNSFDLIEEMAADIIAVIMNNTKIVHCEVEIDKPTPLKEMMDSLSVKLISQK